MNESDILLESGTNELELIEFYILQNSPDGPPVVNSFGVNVAKVLEVIESPELAPIESAPHPSFLGTIPLREKILPVIDLSVWLGIERHTKEHEIILVTEFNQKVTGFLASDIVQIHRVGWKEVQPPSGYISSMEDACVTGFVQIEDRFVQLLDLERILSDLDPDFAGANTVMQEKAAQNYTALIADDSMSMRAMIEDKLKEANFTVLSEQNGEDALRHLNRLKAQAESQDKDVTDLIQIVVSDIEMPAMDGFTLTKNIKDDPKLANIPVILFSSLITNEQLHKGHSVGVDEQIAKPDFPTLNQRVLSLIHDKLGLPVY